MDAGTRPLLFSYEISLPCRRAYPPILNSPKITSPKQGMAPSSVHNDTPGGLERPGCAQPLEGFKIGMSVLPSWPRGTARTWVAVGATVGALADGTDGW